MANRITCPSCDALLTFDDDKRGKKVRCRKCQAVITLPAAKTAKPKPTEETGQDRPALKTKLAAAPVKKTKLAAAPVKTTKLASPEAVTTKRPPVRAKPRDDDEPRPKPARSKNRDAFDDDDDDRPRKKKKKRADKNGLPLGLILGGAAALLLVLMCGGATTAFFIFRKPAPAQLAVVNEVNPPQPGPEKKKEPEPIKNPQPIVNPPPPKIKKEPEPPRNPAPVKTPLIDTDPRAPPERKPADLTVSLTAEKFRTLNMKSSFDVTIPSDKVKRIVIKVETNLLEAMNPDPKGSKVKTALGNASGSLEADGNNRPIGAAAFDIVRNDPPFFVIGPTNRISSKKILKVPPGTPANVKAEAEVVYDQMTMAFQAVSIPMPNRLVQPGENWEAVGPLILGTGAKKVVVDLVLTCTYEGLRTRNQRSEAVVTLNGFVRGRSKFKGKAPPPGTDQVKGKLAFDIAGGFISLVQLRISSEGEQDSLTLDIDLSRVPGNTQNLAVKK